MNELSFYLLKLKDIRKSRHGGKQAFSCAYIKIEMLIRHSNRDAEHVIVHISLELRCEVNAIHIYMVFRVMRSNELRKASAHKAKWRITDPKMKT